MPARLTRLKLRRTASCVRSSPERQSLLRKRPCYRECTSRNTIGGPTSELLSQPVEMLNLVGRKMHARQAVQAVIDKSAPTSRLASSWRRLRVRSDSVDFEVRQQRRRFRREPTRMLRFNDEHSGKPTTKFPQESSTDLWLKCEAGRKLDGERFEFRANPCISIRRDRDDLQIPSDVARE
jgi:hypothetical protein